MQAAQNARLDSDYRRLTGIDKRDEKWEGQDVLTPLASYEHQRISFELLKFIGETVKFSGDGGVVVHGLGVFHPKSPAQDYRVPDLVFVSEARRHLIAPEGLRGGPDVVIEIRSPGDLTDEKQAFYEAMGVGESLVIDRDDKSVSLRATRDGRFVSIPADPNGWVRSEALGIAFRTTADRRLEVVDERRLHRRLTI